MESLLDRKTIRIFVVGIMKQAFLEFAEVIRRKVSLAGSQRDIGCDIRNVVFRDGREGVVGPMWNDVSKRKII